MKLDLHKPVVPLSLEAGESVVLTGFYRSKHDGSIVDAATTTWPKEAPGGASVDAGGLIDFEAGGLHLSSRDVDTHVVEAVVTGDPGTACEAANVASPCLVLRTLPQARSRLLTMDAWAESLQGEISVDVPPVSASAALDATDPNSGMSTLQIGMLGAVAAVIAVALVLVVRARHADQQELLDAVKRIRGKLTTADAALKAALGPAVETAMDKLKGRKVSARSSEGKRVLASLKRVEVQLDEIAQKQQLDAEREAADELLAEMEGALEAANETLAAGGMRR